MLICWKRNQDDPSLAAATWLFSNSCVSQYSPQTRAVSQQPGGGALLGSAFYELEDEVQRRDVPWVRALVTWWVVVCRAWFWESDSGIQSLTKPAMISKIGAQGIPRSLCPCVWSFYGAGRSPPPKWRSHPASQAPLPPEPQSPWHEVSGWNVLCCY